MDIDSSSIYSAADIVASGVEMVVLFPKLQLEPSGYIQTDIASIDSAASQHDAAFYAFVERLKFFQQHAILVAEELTNWADRVVEIDDRLAKGLLSSTEYDEKVEATRLFARAMDPPQDIAIGELSFEDFSTLENLIARRGFISPKDFSYRAAEWISRKAFFESLASDIKHAAHLLRSRNRATASDAASTAMFRWADSVTEHAAWADKAAASASITSDATARAKEAAQGIVEARRMKNSIGETFEAMGLIGFLGPYNRDLREADLRSHAVPVVRGALVDGSNAGSGPWTTPQPSVPQETTSSFTGLPWRSDGDPNDGHAPEAVTPADKGTGSDEQSEAAKPTANSADNSTQSSLQDPVVTPHGPAAAPGALPPTPPAGEEGELSERVAGQAVAPGAINPLGSSDGSVLSTSSPASTVHTLGSGPTHDGPGRVPTAPSQPSHGIVGTPPIGAREMGRIGVNGPRPASPSGSRAPSAATHSDTGQRPHPGGSTTRSYPSGTPGAAHGGNLAGRSGNGAATSHGTAPNSSGRRPAIGDSPGPRASSPHTGSTPGAGTGGTPGGRTATNSTPAVAAGERGAPASDGRKSGGGMAAGAPISPLAGASRSGGRSAASASRSTTRGHGKNALKPDPEPTPPHVIRAPGMTADGDDPEPVWSNR